MSEEVQEGYVAYNGHQFTKAEAEAYQQAVSDAERHPSEFNLDQRHRVFVSIITKGQFYGTARQ